MLTPLKWLRLKSMKVTPVVVDPCGVFRVMVDRDAGELVAMHYAVCRCKGAFLCYSGRGCGSGDG